MADLNIELIGRLINEINITRKKIAFYPEGHSIIKTHINKLISLLDEVFSSKKEFSLGIAKDKIIFEDKLLSSKNPGVQEFANLLFSHGIVFLTFIEGITLEEISKFLKRISEPVEVVKKKGKLVDFIKEENIKHIRVKMLEMKEIPITDEKEIKVSKIQEADVVKENFWIFLIKGLVSKYSSLIDKLSSIEIASGLSPGELAELINDAFEIESSVEPNFSGFLEVYFEIIRKASSKIKIDKVTKKKLEEFIIGLSKEKRNIFITKTLEFSRSATPEEVNLLRNLFDKIFLEVLKYAINLNEDLPKEMLELLEGSSFIKIPENSLKKYKETVKKRRAETMLKDFYRADDIVVYKPEEYKKVFKEFAMKIKKMEYVKPSISDLEEYHEDISEENLQNEVILTLLELIDSEVNEDKYRKLLSEIRNYFDIFLLTGRFKEINLILETLTEHEKKIKRYKKRLKILREFLNEFKSENVLTRLIRELRTVWGEEKYEEIKDIILKYGKEGARTLIEMLSEEEDKFTRSQLVDIIAEFGNTAIDIINEKLNDPKWYVVRNMILILRKMENRDLINKIISLCNHTNSRVKIEALKTLLYFDLPEGKKYLKEFLNNKDEFLYSSSLSLAGAFKVKEVVGTLVGKLKKLKINKKDYGEKVRIVQILGQIGSQEAIPQLKKESRKIYFFKWKKGKEFKKLVQDTLKSLSDIPVE